MKKYTLIILIALLPMTGFSQSLFDKYEDLDDVTAVVVNKSMFNLLSKIDVEVDDPDAKDFMQCNFFSIDTIVVYKSGKTMWMCTTGIGTYVLPDLNNIEII